MREKGGFIQPGIALLAIPQNICLCLWDFTLVVGTLTFSVW